MGDFLLREQIERGKTAVQGIVSEVTAGRVSLFLPGASITGGVFEQTVRERERRAARSARACDRIRHTRRR